jgi:hypothetical protein
LLTQAESTVIMSRLKTRVKNRRVAMSSGFRGFKVRSIAQSSALHCMGRCYSRVDG